MARSGFGFLIKNFPRIALGGIHLWVEPPVRVKIASVEVEIWPALPANPGRHPRPYPLKMFKLKIAADDRQADARVCVDLGTSGIDWSFTTTWLFNKQHKGSGMIGVALFSLPITLPLSPILLAANAAYRSAEKKRGMSRHAAALMRAMRGKLADEDENLLTEAFRNDWTHDRKMMRRVSFEEARGLLEECDLLVRRFGKSEIGPSGEERYWHDADKDCVASIEIEDARLNPPRLCVLGSSFKGEQALALIECFKTRREMNEDDEA